MQQILNIFSLHGKYFNNDENRFTANVLFLLSESRHRFLRRFLEHLKVNSDNRSCAGMQIVFQSPFTSDSGVRKPDAELRLTNDVHILLEAKIGRNLLDPEQLKAYANILKESDANQKRLVCVTQVNNLAEYNSIVKEIEPRILPKGTCVYLQWWQLLDLIKETMGPSVNGTLCSDRHVLRGQRLDYEERIATLFLREVERTMYVKKIIDEIPSGELDDLVVQTQEPWFMDVSKRHCIWFPSGNLEFGQRPTRYVAYYEVDKEGNEFRKQFAYIAKIKAIWNRITLDDARRIKELQSLFTDKSINAEMSTWYNNWQKEGQTFNIAITEEPIKLKTPIPLGKKKNIARFLSKRRYSFVDFLNASTIDDLFQKRKR